LLLAPRVGRCGWFVCFRLFSAVARTSAIPAEVPCSLFPVPCSLFPVLCSLFFVLCSSFSVLRSLFFVLCSRLNLISDSDTCLAERTGCTLHLVAGLSFHPRPASVWIGPARSHRRRCSDSTRVFCDSDPLRHFFAKIFPVPFLSDRLGCGGRRPTIGGSSICGGFRPYCAARHSLGASTALVDRVLTHGARRPRTATHGTTG
jgi:hypothetical protein